MKKLTKYEIEECKRREMNWVFTKKPIKLVRSWELHFKTYNEMITYYEKLLNN